MKKSCTKEEIVTQDDPGHADCPHPIKTVQSVPPFLAVLLKYELHVAVQRKCSDQFKQQSNLFVFFIFGNPAFMSSPHIKHCPRDNEETYDQGVI